MQEKPTEMYLVDESMCKSPIMMYARLVERGTTPPTQEHYPFDPGEAVKDPFGVGCVTPPEIKTAIADAIQSRLDDHPDEWATLAYDQLVKGRGCFNIRRARRAKSRMFASGIC
jgi:hypothetical protein